MYNTQDLYELALKKVAEHEPKSIEELCVWMGVSKYTFYHHFPTDSNAYKEITEEITAVKIRIKSKMLKRWYDGKNATLQIAAFRLLADRDELRALSLQHNEIEIPDDTEININIKRSK